jgi:hypothetical protein
MEAIETHGLFNLSDYLPKRPSASDITVIYDMFQASVDGELYDPVKWADYYRPYGVSASTKPATAQVAQTETVTPVTPVKVEPSSAPATETVNDTSNNKSADEILAMIRNRKNTEEAEA